MKIATLLFCTFCLTGFAASAQNIVSPDSGWNPDTGCLVKGLDPNGDGFLAVRTGPGTGYPQISSLFNGDAAFLGAACQGRWCYIEGAVQRGQTTNLRGWIYDAWCEFYP